MNERSLEALFAKAREAKMAAPLEVPRGFAETVWQRYQQERAQEQALVRTSMVSLATALVILAATVGLNFDSLTAPPDDLSYAGDLASSVCDFTGD
ncbi:MAG: hypothetical protein JO069_07965 [Verrucomicrobia bacterium]|nr:hypothetical protein [Verrucomicrobiota bacterium]